MGPGVSAQEDTGKADGHPSGHACQRPFRLISSEVKSVIPASPWQVGRHILHNFSDHVDLTAAVIAGVFQRSNEAPQILDGCSLQLRGGGHSRRAAAGLFQIMVKLLHQLRIGRLSLQPCHTLEDSVSPEPALFLPGWSPLRLAALPSVLPLNGICGEALRHEGDIESAHCATPLLSRIVISSPLRSMALPSRAGSNPHSR